jgi:small subunit ribosomal protein S17
MSEKIRGRKKTLAGVVVGDKMDKTVMVAVERQFKHPTYKKYIRKTVKYKAHDENNTCAVGDRVLLVESRPLSKTKSWRVSRIVEKQA